MKNKNNKGFTLVEVLAVITILVIIVAIALPNISAMLDRQSCKTTINRAKLIETASERFVATNRNQIKQIGVNECKITIEQLLNKGFIIDDDIDGLDKDNDYIVYDKSNETYTYCFSSSLCKTNESICGSTLTDCISN